MGNLRFNIFPNIIKCTRVDRLFTKELRNLFKGIFVILVVVTFDEGDSPDIFFFDGIRRVIDEQVFKVRQD